MAPKQTTPSKPQTTPRGRDARTGEWITVEQARRRPDTSTVERVPLPGKGVK